jgi:hypothetical protein
VGIDAALAAFGDPSRDEAAFSFPETTGVRNIMSVFGNKMVLFVFAALVVTTFVLAHLWVSPEDVLPGSERDRWGVSSSEEFSGSSGMPPTDPSLRSILSTEAVPDEVADKSFVESHVESILGLLARGDLEGFTEALHQLRCLQSEIDHTDDQLGEVLHDVSMQLVQSALKICATYAAEGDLALAASLIAELRCVDLDMYWPEFGLYSRRDFVFYCFDVMQKSGSDPKSKAFRSLERTVSFFKRCSEIALLNSQTVYPEETMGCRDSLVNYSANPYFDRGRFIDLMNGDRLLQASAYLGNVASIYESRILTNPRSALAGLAFVVGSTEDLDEDYYYLFGENIGRAQRSILGMVQAMFQGESARASGRSTSPLGYVVKLWQILEDLNQFGVRDPVFLRDVVLIARPSVARHIDKPKVRARWNSMLSWYGIDDQSLRF